VLELTQSPALQTGHFERDGFRLSENTNVALASLAVRLGQEKKCATLAKKLFGTALPGPQEFVSGGVFTVFWTGPDQYFIQAPMETFEDIETRVRAALKETASVTDQSGGWVRLDIEGTKTVAVFERLSMVDLATTPPHRAMRTVIEHIGCFIVTREDGLSVWAPRSYAGSLFHAVEVAAKSV